MQCPFRAPGKEAPKIKAWAYKLLSAPRLQIEPTYCWLHRVSREGCFPKSLGKGGNSLQIPPCLQDWAAYRCRQGDPGLQGSKRYLALTTALSYPLRVPVVEAMVVMPSPALPRTPSWGQRQSPFFSVTSFQGRGAVSWDHLCKLLPPTGMAESVSLHGLFQEEGEGGSRQRSPLGPRHQS